MSEDRLLQLSRATKCDVDIPVPTGLRYLSYQPSVVEYSRLQPASIRGILLADDMGLGKTVQAIAWMNMHTPKRVLLLCPATLRLNWFRELTKWLVRPARILVADSTIPKWKADMAEVLIVNYDILTRLIKWRLTGVGLIHPISFGALESSWDLLICDEAHLCRNVQSQRGALTFALSARSAFTLFLTGTPIDNRPEELFPFANRLDPETFPNKFSFRQTYCTTRARLPQLQRIARSRFMIRRLKSDVLTDLPPKIRQVIEIAPDDAATRGAIASERAAWDRREEQVITLKVQVELAKAGAADDYAASVRALGQAVSASWSEMAKLRKETAIRKVPYVIKHLQSFLDDDLGYKVVVFGWHVEPIHKIAAAFRSRVAVVTGEVSAAMKVVNGRETSDRMTAVDRFQEDPTCQIFLGNMEAAGVGLTLTAASHAVLYEQAWKPSTIRQAEDRLHRYGQRNSVLVQHLVLEGSIDARMAKAVVEKQELIDAALDQDEAATLEEEAVIPVDEAATSGLTRAAVERAAKELSDDVDAMRERLAALSAGRLNKIDGRLRTLLLTDSMNATRAVLARKITGRYE